MNVALLGGTGDIGAALALRWARDTDHTVIIGSRDPDRAQDRVADYEANLIEYGATGSLVGCSNEDAAEKGDIVVCAVPPYYLTDTIDAVAEGLGERDILVSPAVGIKQDEAGAHYNRPSTGSVTALADRAAPDDVSVVGAFHCLPAAPLQNLGTDIDAEVPVVGDDESAVETVVELTERIEGLCARRAGGLDNAAEVEALAPLLINLGTYDKDLHDVCVTFH